MAVVPHSWGAYARLQSKLSATTSITFGGALEAALNVIHQPDFGAEGVAEGVAEAYMLRLAANAARQERHRRVLRRQTQAAALDKETAARGSGDGDVSTGASSLDDQLHARRELQRAASRLPDDDWVLTITQN